jgi:hypothetical protein
LRGPVGLTALLRMPPAVIVLTAVAARTPVPERAVGGGTAGQGSVDLALGHLAGAQVRPGPAGRFPPADSPRKRIRHAEELLMVPVSG